jgi:hypothetical protein
VGSSHGIRLRDRSRETQARVRPAPLRRGPECAGGRRFASFDPENASFVDFPAKTLAQPNLPRAKDAKDATA